MLSHKARLPYKLIRDGETSDLPAWLYHRLANLDGEIMLSKHQTALLAKIKRFHLSYKDCKAKSQINAIEAIQPHIIASVLKCRRAFSLLVARRIMMINCANYNGWNLTMNKVDGIALDDGG